MVCVWLFNWLSSKLWPNPVHKLSSSMNKVVEEKYVSKFLKIHVTIKTKNVYVPLPIQINSVISMK